MNSAERFLTASVVKRYLKVSGDDFVPSSELSTVGGPMDNPRELTDGECRDYFMKKLCSIVLGAEEAIENGTSVREALEGVLFSLTTWVDGEGDGPSFRIVANENPENQEYHRVRNRNWWPSNTGIELSGEVTSGDLLHDSLFDYIDNYRGRRSG